ncbi:MAG: hypothetical protein ACC646_03140 [Paracoccaceae bacterium]
MRPGSKGRWAGLITDGVVRAQEDPETRIMQELRDSAHLAGFYPPNAENQRRYRARNMLS